jgi:hypothetical protein
MLDPSWVTAGADLTIAAESGVMMIGKRKSRDNEPEQPSVPVAILQPGITNQALIVSAMIVALAILLAAGVVHHGLVA